MRLYFVRHGQTDWNKARKLQGQVDVPLNEFGEQLAIKTAKGLKNITFDVCYTSPLLRARRTAELILEPQAGKVPIIEDDRIREMSFGVYEGKNLLHEVPKTFHDGFNHPERYVVPEGGESFQEVLDRTADFLKEISHRPEYQETTILVTTHGAALAGILANIKEAGISNYWGVGVHKNCAVTEVLVSNGRFQIISENQVYYDDEVEDWRA